MRLYAHRGSHGEAVENTLEAFSRAIAEGADGVELDARRAADGAVVVFHDADLRRLAGDPRRVGDLPREALPPIGGARIPTLDEVLDLVLGAGLEVNVEIKDAPYEVADLLARRGPSEREGVIASSFLAPALEIVRARLPSLRLALLVEEPGAALPPHLDGLHPRHDLCTPERLRRWRARDLFVNVWTVNDPARVPALRAMGVDGLMTDRLALLREACRSPP